MIGENRSINHNQQSQQVQQVQQTEKITYIQLQNNTNLVGVNLLNKITALHNKIICSGNFKNYQNATVSITHQFNKLWTVSPHFVLNITSEEHELLNNMVKSKIVQQNIKNLEWQNTGKKLSSTEANNLIKKLKEIFSDLTKMECRKEKFAGWVAGRVRLQHLILLTHVAIFRNFLISNGTNNINEKLLAHVAPTEKMDFCEPDLTLSSTSLSHGLFPALDYLEYINNFLKN